jgi:multiple sugar transport system permease protein
MFEMSLVRPFDTHFVGLGNFQKLLIGDYIFWRSVWGTIRWMVTITVGHVAIALPVALLLNLKFAWRGLLRTVVVLPWVVPGAVTAIIWNYMFDANFGVMNEILLRLGLIHAYIPWGSDDLGSFFILWLAGVWAGYPFVAVMLLATLQVIPEELYEAARIDGAGAWQSFRFVTFQHLLPTILVVLLFRTIWLAQSVDLIYLMTGGGPGIANYTVAVYSFKLTADTFDVGLASAVAVLLAIVLLGASVFYIRHIERTREFMG